MPAIILFITDIFVIVASFILSLVFRFKGLINVVVNQWWTFVFIIFFFFGFFYFYDLFNHLLYAQRIRLFFRIIKVWFICLLLYVVIGFLTKFSFLVESRVFIFSFYTFSLIFFFLIRLLLAPKILEAYFLNTRRKNLCRYVGPANKFKIIKRFFDENLVTGLNIFVAGGSCNPGTSSKEIFLYSQAKDFSELYQEIKSNILPGYPLHIGSKLFPELNLNWQWCYVDSLPVYTFCLKKNQSLRDYFRRLIDIAISIGVLLMLIPIFALIAVAIKLDSQGPVIYKQKRGGKNGKEFTCYKFRSMFERENKDEMREIEFKNYIERKTLKGKVMNTLDITTIGRILRKTSLDELPQFVNVLKGEMSLIGPRPPIPYEVRHYKKWHRDRLLVKPGISGLWQIYGRGDMPCDSSIFLDLMYIINRSISLNIKLLFQTIPAVVLGKGAY